jgi:hypothetical protein
VASTFYLEVIVNDYDPLRDYLKKQTLAEFVLSFEQIEEIIDAALPRAAQRASWWETLRSPQEKMPQREACLEAGYIATRQADGKSVKFKKMQRDNRRAREGGEV